MSQTEHRTIGELIRARREKLGLTQAALAERAGLSVDSIGDYERGTGAKSFYWDTIKKLAAALELAPGTAEYEEFVRLAREQTVERGRGKDRRAWLIGQVRAFWVDGVLEQRLRGLEYINLRMVVVPDPAGGSSAALDTALSNPSVHGPSGPSIFEVFDALQGTLLIVGNAGSGKTVMLLAITKALLNRTRGNSEARIPIFVPLGSWADAQPSLARWLEDELARIYLVSRELCQQLLDDVGIVLLLDGLDEVRPEHRDSCIAAINTFRRKYPCRLVISCRTNAYKMLPGKLDVDGALELQPLSDAQVDAALYRAEKRVATVRKMLQEEDAELVQAQDVAQPGGKLRELAASPLMLSIIVQLYDGVTRDEFPSYRSLKSQRSHLLDAYLARMLGRQDYSSYSAYHTRHTRAALSWLAQQLQRTGQTLFFLDQIQPAWLASQSAQRAYYLMDRLCGALIGGLILSLGFAGVVTAYGLIRQLGATYWSGLLPDLLLMLSIGAMLGGLFGGHPERHSAGVPVFWTQVRDRVIGWVSGGLLLGTVVFVITASIPSALVCSLMGALAGLLMGRPTLRGRLVVLVEERRWSWERTLRLLPAYLSAGIVVGLLIGLLVGQVDGLLGQLLPPLTASIVAGLLTGLLASAIFGVTYRDDEEKAVPNQGIWRSGRNAIRSGLEGALGGALFGALVMAGPVSWIITALIVGLIGALACGGITVISHLALRLVIWQHTPFPLRSVRFLEHAVERGVLQRVGGGYQFLHPLLREHLARESDGAALQEGTIGSRLGGGRGQTWSSSWRTFAGFTLILVAVWVGALLITRGQPVTNVLAQPHLIIDAAAPGYVGVEVANDGVRPGDTVTVIASGVMAIGPWSRNVGPAGIDRGGLGFPLGDVFKRERDFPTGALLCRVVGEQAWRLCGVRVQFVSTTQGTLEFLVNDVATQRHEGRYLIAITVQSPQVQVP